MPQTGAQGLRSKPPGIYSGPRRTHQGSPSRIPRNLCLLCPPWLSSSLNHILGPFCQPNIIRFAFRVSFPAISGPNSAASSLQQDASGKWRDAAVRVAVRAPLDYA